MESDRVSMILSLWGVWGCMRVYEFTGYPGLYEVPSRSRLERRMALND
jgi:hypothetical protein